MNKILSLLWNPINLFFLVWLVFWFHILKKKLVFPTITFRKSTGKLVEDWTILLFALHTSTSFEILLRGLHLLIVMAIQNIPRRYLYKYVINISHCKRNMKVLKWFLRRVSKNLEGKHRLCFQRPSSVPKQ